MWSVERHSGRRGHLLSLQSDVRTGASRSGGTELGEGAAVGPWKQLFGWFNWRGSGHEHLVGCLRPDGLLSHPALEEASGQKVGSFFQHAPEDEGWGALAYYC